MSKSQYDKQDTVHYAKVITQFENNERHSTLSLCGLANPTFSRTMSKNVDQVTCQNCIRIIRKICGGHIRPKWYTIKAHIEPYPHVPHRWIGWIKMDVIPTGRLFHYDNSKKLVKTGIEADFREWYRRLGIFLDDRLPPYHIEWEEIK